MAEQKTMAGKPSSVRPQRRDGFVALVVQHSGRPHRVRVQRLAVLGVVVGMLAGFYPLAKPITAAAAKGCVQNSGNDVCRYTQLENDNWPIDSSDPECYDQCAWYLHASGPQYYSYADLIDVMSEPGVDFHGWMRKAVSDWSGLPYNSPFFYACNCSSGQFLTVGNLQTDYNGTSQTDTTNCGFGNVTTAWQAYGSANDNHIVWAYADYNDQYSGQWADTNNPPASGSYCSAAHTAYHEVGHAFGEGHSTADSGEIMYVNPTNFTGGSNYGAIDGDAQQLLDVVYGPYSNSSNNGGSGGCNGCQLACPQITEATAADGIQTINSALWTMCGTGYSLPYVWGYYNKLWDIAQGLPAPAAGVLLQGLESCDTYFVRRELLPWLNCVKPIV